MGVGAGLYMCDVVKKKFTFAISSPDEFLFRWLLNKKAARVEVNISLAFLHWVRITFRPWPFVSDIAIFVLKMDVKLQLTDYHDALSFVALTCESYICIVCMCRTWVNFCISQGMWWVRIWIGMLSDSPLPSNRHHRSNGDCLEGKRENH